jgi:hypothetical protein
MSSKITSQKFYRRPRTGYLLNSIEIDRALSKFIFQKYQISHETLLNVRRSKIKFKTLNTSNFLISIVFIYVFLLVFHFGFLNYNYFIVLTEKYPT